MFQSVMTANCPLYIHLPIKYDIYKGGFPKKLWDHKCLLVCFLGDTPPFPQTWNGKATLFQNEADLWPHVDTLRVFPETDCKDGPTSALTLGQRRHTSIGPTWICQLCQHWANIGPFLHTDVGPMLRQWLYATVVPTLAQWTNPCWANVSIPMLAQCLCANTGPTSVCQPWLKVSMPLLTDAITLTPYMVLPLFATRFADYAGGIRVSFIQPRLF